MQDKNTLSTYESVNFRKILHIIFKRKLTIIIVFLASLASSVLLSYLVSPEYETSAKILVRLGRETSNMPASVLKTELMISDTAMTQLNTESKLISSRDTIEKAVDKLGIDSFKNLRPTVLEKFRQHLLDFFRTILEKVGLVYPLTPKERIILEIQQNLEVVPEESSRIITVNFFSKNQEIGSKFLSTLISLYIEKHLEAYTYNNEYTLFNDEMEKAQKALDDSEKKINTFKATWNISNPEAERQILLSKISDLEVALKNTAHLDTAKLNNETIQRLNVLSESAQNPIIAALAMKLIDMEARRDAMTLQYFPTYKPLKDLGDQIASLQKRLKKEAEVTAKAAADTLEKLKIRLNLLSEKLDDLKDLQNTAELNRKRYEFLKNKQEEAAMINAMNQAKVVNVTVTEPPVMNPRPVAPKKLYNIMIGIILGLAGGFWLAFFMEYARRTIEFPEDMNYLKIPTLASFWESENPKNIQKSCQELYFSLKPYMDNGKNLLLFTSSCTGEGTTTIANAFARHMAENSDENILLIDANAYQTDLTQKYAMQNKEGLTDIFTKDYDIKKSIHGTDISNLKIVPNGHIKGTKYYEQGKINKSIDAIADNFNIVIFDVAPVTFSSDYLNLVPVATQIILVVGADSTKRQVVEHAVNKIQIGTKKDITGVVINKRRQFIPYNLYRYI